MRVSVAAHSAEGVQAFGQFAVPGSHQPLLSQDFAHMEPGSQQEMGAPGNLQLPEGLNNPRQSGPRNSRRMTR